jgi:hypothetical protein
MSAFVIDSTTMHKAVRAISFSASGMMAFGHHLGDAKSFDKIGQALFALNIEAVNQRYPDTRANAFRLPGGDIAKADEYRFNDNFSPLHTLADKVACLKALSCLLYQCSEGNVPETETYKELRKMQADMALAIVSRLPEYDAAPWG